MADFNYNQTIEYIDGTRDLNFEAARKWAYEHNTTFEEDVDKREPYEQEYEEECMKPEGGIEICVAKTPTVKRYFKIGSKPVVHVETEEEIITRKQSQVRQIRDQYLNDCQDRVDRYHNQNDAGITTADSTDTFKHLLEYMEVLRNFPQQLNWWESYPPIFAQWEQETYSSQGDKVNDS